MRRAPLILVIATLAAAGPAPGAAAAPAERAVDGATQQSQACQSALAARDRLQRREDEVKAKIKTASEARKQKLQGRLQKIRGRLQQVRVAINENC